MISSNLSCLLWICTMVTWTHFLMRLRRAYTIVIVAELFLHLHRECTIVILYQHFLCLLPVCTIKILALFFFAPAAGLYYCHFSSKCLRLRRAQKIFRGWRTRTLPHPANGDFDSFFHVSGGPVLL